MKRTFSLILTLVIVIGILTSVPVTVSAASTSDLTFESINGGKSYYVYDCKSSAKGNIVIPDTYMGKPVTRIGSSAFSECTMLTSIEIPDSVKSIAENAFRNCTNLTSITLPDSLKSIGYLAFYNTGYYNNRNNWDKSALYIGNHLIRARTSLKGDYEVKKGTVTIADNAFLKRENLKSVTISDSLTSIGLSAFESCTGLKSITIPDSVISIGARAFAICEKLTSITIPDSVTSIASAAFRWCINLETIKIGSSVTSIGEGAFFGVRILLLFI